MKNFFTVLFTLISFYSFSQSASQDFGTGTGSWSTSNTSSTAWIPNPAVSGTTWGRVSNGGGGNINLVNPGLAILGAGSELRAAASSSTSVMKFSPIVGYTVGNQFYTKFDVVFGDVSGGNSATSGEWAFYQGTTSGGFYADVNDYAANKVFTGLRWTYGASGALTFEYLNSATWTAVSTFQTQGNKYTIEIFGSNSGGTINYTYGTAQTVADNKYDVWINGVLVLNDVNKGQASNGATVDAITFIGKNSTSNAANIFVDNFSTYNSIAAVPTITPSCSTPTVDASSITFSGTTTNSTTVNWTSGNGNNRILVAKQNSLVSGSPSNLTTYTANTTFGSGSTIATNEYVVYNGFNNSQTVTGLTAGAAYNFKVFEYNCSGGNELYLNSSPPNASVLIKPNTPLSFTAGCGSDTTITLTWTTPAGFSDGFLVFANSVSNTYTPNGAGSSYTGASSIYNSAASYGGEKLVYSGTGNTVTVTGLTAGTTYYFRTYSYVSSTYSAASAISSSYAGMQPVTSASATTGNGILTLNWTNPTTCWDSIMIVATDNSTLTYVPSGDGSGYVDNAFYGDPSAEISGSNVFCVYKGTGSSLVLFGLTNTVLYRMKIYVRDGDNWSTGVLVTGTPNTTTGDFQSVTSGNWNNNTTWQKWNGTTWVATAAGEYPNTPTASATVLSGHTVTVNGSGPYSFLNLTIQSGGKVYCNSNTTPVYFNMYQQINCDGILGNGATADAISVNAEGNSTTGCAIGGSGTCSLSRIRKEQTTNTTTKFMIDMDITLTYTGTSQTVLYNDRANTIFNVIVSGGSVVNTPVGGNVAIDGVDGADNGKNQGSIDVYGTLNVGGTYYMTTNNNGGSGISLTIENGGVVNVASIDASSSAHAPGHSLIVKNGGLLNITSTTFNNFSTNNNSYTCTTGSTVNYSANAAQTIESGITYSNLICSVSGNKTPNGDITAGSLTVDAAVFNINTSLKTLFISLNLTLQNGGTMSDNCKTLLNITPNHTSSIQLFTGNNQIIKCLNFSATKIAGKVEFIGSSGNSDLYIRNTFKIDFTGTAKLIDNGNTISVGNDVELGSATSTSSNFQLTGTLKFVCIGAAASTDIHLSDYTGTGITIANINNLTIDAETGSLINQVQIFPAAGGQSLNIKGNVSIQNSNSLSNFLNPNSNTLVVNGNWSDYSAAGFTEGTGQVLINGSAASQSITGAETFYKLHINNSNGVTLNNTVTVSNQLTLSNGIVTTGSNELNVTNAAITSVTGNSPNSFVSGNIRRAVSSTGTYDFPVGNSNYQLATVTLNSSAGMSNILAYFNSTITGTAPSYPTTQINGTGINGLLNSGFWTITPNAYSSVNYDITINERGYSNFSGNANQLGVIKRPNSSSTWSGTNTAGSNGFHNNATQTIASGTATAKRTGVTSFSDFAIGYGANALPVELTTFTAKAVDNKSVALFWNTQAELNCSYFSVERSADGNEFSEIGKVAGNGTSQIAHDYNFSDNSPLCGTAYYRLMQVDENGEYHYTPIASAVINCNSSFSFYPNPTTAHLSVNMSNEIAANATVKIMGLDGKIYLQKNISSNQFSLDVKQLPAGFYFMQIENGNETMNNSFIKE